MATQPSAQVRAGAPGARPAVALLVVGNGLSTFLECGVGLCPDNPTEHEMLHE